MPIRYSIQSSVVDILKDTPSPSDSFFVDTNIWFWITYTKASSCANPPKIYQIQDYPNYINAALKTRAKLYRCGLSLPELSHIIEKSEREIYENNHGVTLSPKEYRHNFPSERATTVNEIEVSWNQVKSMSDLHDITIDEQKCCNLIQLIKGTCIDGYDAFLTIQEQTLDPNFKIITDDGDFSSIPDIIVFTSNKSIIRAANGAGKLITR